jgi:HEAT repeat protein
LTEDHGLPSLKASDADADFTFLVRKAKDILTTLANAVSAIKIFPPEHDTIRNFVTQLGAKFDDFFENAPQLQVDIAEHSFIYAERVVFTDETPVKSLPFFFFKDGMEILYFYRGLEGRELFEFLALIKNVSQRPAESNDIVAALWESDFSNIQYSAPDEFLENLILAEKREIESKDALPGLPSDLAHETLEVRVDRLKHAEGQIMLKPADRERLARGLEAPGPEGLPTEDEPPNLTVFSEKSAGLQPGSSALASNLSGADVEELETLVRANRLLWPEEEIINLTAEIIFLEEDLAICAASLDLLGDFYLDQVRAGQFPAAALVITKLRELRSQIDAGASRKAALVDAFLAEAAGPKALGAMDAALGSNLPVGWPAVLTFFKLLGPSALPTAAGLFEKLSDAEVRTQVLDFIRESGQADLNLVVRLAGDARPALSLEIIGLLSDLPEEKGIPAMSVFLGFRNRDIKVEAIQALGRRPGEKSSRILLGFFDDPDEVIRIQAALHLKQVEEKSRILHVIKKASTPEFRKKSFKEKQAVLSFLGRTRTPDALSFLSAALKRKTLWPSKRRLEMRLAAVSGLESMGTAEARATLEAGRRAFGKKVRKSCAEALERISASNSRRT